MGTARSLLRPIKNFNIESKVHKELERNLEKPKVAPRHKINQGRTLLREDIDLPEEEEFSKKDEALDDMLKSVRVDSQGPPPPNPRARPLPEEITARPQPEYGIVEPKNIPQGKVTIRQALDMISNYQADPKTYNSAHLAKEYKLELYETQQILKYFQTFHMHIPKKMEERFPYLLDALKEKVSTIGSEKQKQLLDVAKDSSKIEESKTKTSIGESS